MSDERTPIEEYVVERPTEDDLLPIGYRPKERRLVSLCPICGMVHPRGACP